MKRQGLEADLGKFKSRAPHFKNNHALERYSQLERMAETAS